MSIDFGATDKPADLAVQNHGTIFLLDALTPAGEEWIEENVVVNDETQYYAGALVVEHRYIEGLVAGALADGLVVR